MPKTFLTTYTKGLPSTALVWGSGRSRFITFLSVIAVLIAGAWILHSQAEKNQRLAAQNENLETQIASFSNSQLPVSQDLAKHWPSSVPVDAVITFLGTLAKELQIDVISVQVSPPNLTNGIAAGFVRTDISLQLRGPYAPSKQLLSQLLARYETLSIQTLSLKPVTNDSARLDWSLQLGIYTKGVPRAELLNANQK